MGKPSQQVRTYLCGLTCLVIASHDLVELYRSMVNYMCSQRGILTSGYRSLSIGLPLCWKAFLKIPLFISSTGPGKPFSCH